LDSKKIILFAVNVSSGGGKVLLDTLLETKNFGEVAVLFKDERYQIPEVCHNSISLVISVPPTLMMRWKAELKLQRVAKDFPDLEIVSFGNLPPMLKHKNKVNVYLQNAFLLPNLLFPRSGLKSILRNIYERTLWLLFKKNIDEIWVQSRWMYNNCYPHIPCKIMPFLPYLEYVDSSKLNRDIDYLMVTSLDGHKNLNYFLEKLLELKSLDKLSFCLVVSIDLSKSSRTRELINICRERWPEFIHFNEISRTELINVYKRSRCLINSSDVESFCLPIHEALKLGCKVWCLNREFSLEIPEVKRHKDIKSLVESIGQLSLS
jgi:glycosyltransferase involved in cell wall biosynthesis